MQMARPSRLKEMSFLADDPVANFHSQIVWISDQDKHTPDTVIGTFDFPNRMPCPVRALEHEAVVAY